MKRIHTTTVVMAVLAFTLAYVMNNAKMAAQASTQATAHPNKNVEQVLIQIENEWPAALLKGDLAPVERTLADDWVSTNDKGEITTVVV